LEHLLGQEYSAFEVIVVDSSSDERTQRLLAAFPDIKNIRILNSKNNRPQAKNLGIKDSKGQIIAFIDDDSIVQDGWLKNIVAGYINDSVGAVGGRILEKPNLGDSFFPKEVIAKITSKGSIITKNLDANCPGLVEVDDLRGCNMSFSRTAIMAVGGFDPRYTLYNWIEETDLCARVKKSGFRVIFNSKAIVFHYAARDRSKGIFVFFDPMANYSGGRNSAYFAVKNFGFCPAVLLAQVKDTFRKTGKLFICSVLLLSSVFAHLIGRCVGIFVGLETLITQRYKDMSPNEPNS